MHVLNRVGWAAGLAALTLLAGCTQGPGVDSGSEPTCSTNTDCAGGDVCRAGRCVTLCSGDNNCDADEYCTGGTCAPISTIEGCGNGVPDPGETCDDGHNVNSDDWSLAPHCNSQCTAKGPYCGDGSRHPAELCDGNCPDAAACADQNACTLDIVTGSAATCDAQCDNVPIVACTDNDGCCPSACDWWKDNDCAPLAAFQGQVRRFDSVSPQPDSDVTVSVVDVNWDANRDGVVDATDATMLVSDPTFSSGDYQVRGTIPAAKTIVVQTKLVQSTGDDGINFTVPSSIVARQLMTDTTWQNAARNPFVVKFSWLARTAYQCGLYPSFEAAAGTNAINPDFIATSTIVGTLLDSAGQPVAGIPRHAISVELDQDTSDATPGFLNSNRTFVCFLEAPGSILQGSTRTTSSSTGMFVVYRLTRSDTLNIGAGTATVRVVDYGSGVEFTPVTLQLGTSQIGVVTLTTDDQPPAVSSSVDFSTEVVPIFGNRGCTGCHYSSGPGSTLLREDEQTPGLYHAAIWEGSSDDIYTRLTGPGRTCGSDCFVNQTWAQNSTYPRICIDSVDCSLLVARPTDGTGLHPLQAFLPGDPDLITIREWIAQGARRYSNVDFATDIMPIFTRNNCTAGCHDAGQPGGDLVRSGYAADFVGTPDEAWAALRGPGTVCSRVAFTDPAYPRVCVDEPMRSLLALRFIDGHATGTPGTHMVPPALGTVPAADFGLLLQWMSEGANPNGAP